jgi:hypothetical protein
MVEGKTIRGVTRLISVSQNIMKMHHTRLQESLKRRSAKRFDVELKGMVFSKTGGRTVAQKVLSRNITGWGAYLLTDKCPRTGDRIEVYLSQPSEIKLPKISFGAVGRILRVEPLSEKEWGFAVKFEEVWRSSDSWAGVDQEKPSATVNVMVSLHGVRNETRGDDAHPETTKNLAS